MFWPTLVNGLVSVVGSDESMVAMRYEDVFQVTFRSDPTGLALFKK